MKRSMFRAGLIVLAAAGLPASAFASGHLPVPPVTQEFKTPRACIEALEGFYAADRKQVAAKERKPNGDTREVDLDTKGVERLGPEGARYEATLWYHNGHFRSDFQKTETSHTFETRQRECSGATLRITGENGYTLSTLDP